MSLSGTVIEHSGEAVMLSVESAEGAWSPHASEAWCSKVYTHMALLVCAASSRGSCAVRHANRDTLASHARRTAPHRDVSVADHPNGSPSSDIERPWPVVYRMLAFLLEQHLRQGGTQ